ncbi:hypothetical protein EDD15DRAFT_2380723 [Pisolithus albus]|nr:hypothetical protein EDD15DRAFT_2380723 [Pisolithus albus]
MDSARASIAIDPALLVNAPAPRNSSASTQKANASQHDSYAAYELAGRKMACLVNPNFSVRTALKVGIMDLRGRYEDIPMEQSEVERYFDIFNRMLRYVPWLEDELKIMDAPEFDKVANKLTKGMSDQRSMDLGSVKHAGLAYIPLKMNTTFTLDPPLSKGEDKSDRGFNHPQIARLLCPRKKLHLFDEDEAGTMIALQTGAIPVTVYNWPSFFYEDGVYDPQNRLCGLFRGHIAWRFYVHLFIGPSAAAKGVVTSNTAKRAKNRAWSLTEVTPHIIAYVHVIAYFTLTAEQKWTNATGNIDLAEMAWTIVDMFEDRDEWTRQTLEWWNTRAFPHRPQNRSRSLKHRLEPDSDDDVMHIRAKRGSTVSSNTPAADSSSGSFGDNVPSNDTSLASGSNVVHNLSGSTSVAADSTESSDATSFNFDSFATEGRNDSPLTSDGDMESPLVAVRRPKPVLKKRKKADDISIFTRILCKLYQLKI